MDNKTITEDSICLKLKNRQKKKKSTVFWMFVDYILLIPRHLLFSRVTAKLGYLLLPQCILSLSGATFRRGMIRSITSLEAEAQRAMGGGKRYNKVAVQLGH